MTRLFINARNAEFHSRDDGAEYERPEDALAFGVKSAMDIVADEIGRGERSAAVEISVERHDGTELLRSVVAVSVSPLMPLISPVNSVGE